MIPPQLSTLRPQVLPFHAAQLPFPAMADAPSAADSREASPPRRQRHRWFAIALWTPLYAIAMTILLEACNQAKFPSILRFPLEHPANAAMNLAILLPLAWFCIALTARPLAGLGLAALPLLLLGIANRLKKNFLFDPIFPDDVGQWR